MYESNITLSVNLLSFLINMIKRIKNLNLFDLKPVGYFNIFLQIYIF